MLYSYGILMEGGILQIVKDTGILCLGTCMLVFAVAGHFLTSIPRWQRVLLIIAGIMTCIPEAISDYIGFAIGGFVIILHVIKYIGEKDQRIAAAAETSKVVKTIIADTSEVNLDEE